MVTDLETRTVMSKANYSARRTVMNSGFRPAASGL